MDYQLWKLLHFIGLFILFFSFSALIFLAFQNKRQKGFFILHLIGWVLILVSSFGLVGALGLHENFPAWANGKFYSWILIGLISIIGYFRAGFLRKVYPLSLALGIFATILATYKP